MLTELLTLPAALRATGQQVGVCLFAFTLKPLTRPELGVTLSDRRGGPDSREGLQEVQAGFRWGAHSPCQGPCCCC